MEPGEVSGSLGLGNNYLGKEPFVDLALRTGINETMDVGAKLNITNYGSSLATIDLKRRLTSNSTVLHHAVGFGTSLVFSDDKGVVLHVPYFLSMHTPNDKIALYTNPRLLYFIDGDQEDSFANNGPGLGSSFGIKIGKKISFMFEYGFLYGEYDGDTHFNNLLSGGIGINVR